MLQPCCVRSPRTSWRARFRASLPAALGPKLASASAVSSARAPSNSFQISQGELAGEGSLEGPAVWDKLTGVEGFGESFGVELLLWFGLHPQGPRTRARRRTEDQNSGPFGRLTQIPIFGVCSAGRGSSKLTAAGLLTKSECVPGHRCRSTEFLSALFYHHDESSRGSPVA